MKIPARLQRLGFSQSTPQKPRLRIHSPNRLVLTTQLHGEHHITIPHHRPLKVGTLHGILRDLAEHHVLSMDELLRTLGKRSACPTME